MALKLYLFSATCFLVSTLQILIEPSQLELTTVLPALSRSTLSTGAVWPSRLTVAKVEVFITWNARIHHKFYVRNIYLDRKVCTTRHDKISRHGGGDGGDIGGKSKDFHSDLREKNALVVG